MAVNTNYLMLSAENGLQTVNNRLSELGHAKQDELKEDARDCCEAAMGHTREAARLIRRADEIQHGTGA